MLLLLWFRRYGLADGVCSFAKLENAFVLAGLDGTQNIGSLVSSEWKCVSVSGFLNRRANKTAEVETKRERLALYFKTGHEGGLSHYADRGSNYNNSLHLFR